MIWIALAITILSRLADIYTSRRGIYYNTNEANALWRDKNGQFSTLKNGIASAILLTGITILALHVEYMWTLFLPFGFGSFYIAWANYRLQRKNRVAQTAFLTNLQDIQKNGASQIDIEVAFNDRLMVTQNGRTYYDMFQWISVEGQGVDPLVKQRLITLIADLAKLSPFEWFPA